LKSLIVEGKENYVGTPVVALKPGYEQLAQKQLAEFPPTNLLTDIEAVALRLKGTGNLFVREE